MADTQEKRIQIIFKADTEHGRFQDALWFTEAEYEKVTQEAIDIKKQERIDNWIAVVTAPSIELSKEEKIAKVQSEIDITTLRLQELEAQKINVSKV